MTHLCTTDPQEIAHLDYSKPPPGYLVHDLNDDGWWWRIDEPEDGCTAPFETEAEAIAAAWAHYKAHNDPPGIATAPDDSLPLFHPLRLRGRCRWTILVTVGGVQFGGEAVAADQPAARVAAWAWHDRRHALVARLEDEGVQVDMWPHALVWTDSECLECERWPGMRALPDDFPAVLRSLAEMPEVLRG